MRRRWFAVIGGFFLDVAALAGALLGSAALRSPRVAVGIATWLLVGGLAVVGGLRESVAGVAWYRFVGASDVLLGLWMVGFAVAWYLEGAADGALASVAAQALGGLVIALVGVDWFRGGRHFDLSAYESGPILGDAPE